MITAGWRTNGSGYDVSINPDRAFGFKAQPFGGKSTRRLDENFKSYFPKKKGHRIKRLIEAINSAKFNRLGYHLDSVGVPMETPVEALISSNAIALAIQDKVYIEFSGKFHVKGR